MSEQNTSIASGSKVKDPRRVAAGKRLGAISNIAKEEKALRLKQQSDSYSSESNENTLYLVGGLVVVGAASYLLFMNKKKVVRTLTGDKEKLDPEPEPTIPAESPKKKSSSIFDD